MLEMVVIRGERSVADGTRRYIVVLQGSANAGPIQSVTTKRRVCPSLSGSQEDLTPNR